MSDLETEKENLSCMRKVGRTIILYPYYFLLPLAIAFFYYYTYDSWNNTTGALTDVEIPFGYLISCGVFLAVITFLATLMFVFITCQKASFNGETYRYTKHDCTTTMSCCYLVFVVASG